MKKNIRKITALLLTAALALSAFSVSPAQAARKKKAVFDPNGKYHATLGIQTCTNLWLTHMGYYEKSQNSYYNTKNADNLMYTDKETNKDTAATGTLTNAEIAGNGTYTVKLEGLDSMNETDISQLHIATDIPLNDKVKFTDVKASINGRLLGVSIGFVILFRILYAAAQAFSMTPGNHYVGLIPVFGGIGTEDYSGIAETLALYGMLLSIYRYRNV